MTIHWFDIFMALGLSSIGLYFAEQARVRRKARLKRGAKDAVAWVVMWGGLTLAALGYGLLLTSTTLFFAIT